MPAHSVFESHLCRRVHDKTLVDECLSPLPPEQELVQDLLSIVHVFSARLYGLRSYEKIIKEAVSNHGSTHPRAQDPAASDS